MGRGFTPSDPALFVARCIEVIECAILPVTRDAVAKGSRVFGAAILRKADLSIVTVGTNKFAENPLFHGEVSCLHNFYALPVEERPEVEDCVFLCTHEPCSLCLSAITWSGFDNFFYLFSYENTKNEFDMSHDLLILKEVFGVVRGEYNRKNAYWTAASLKHLLKEIQDSQTRKELDGKFDRLGGLYNHLWETEGKNLKDCVPIECAEDVQGA